MDASEVAVPVVRVRVRTSAVSLKTEREQKALGGDDTFDGKRAHRCLDCGYWACQGHAGKCEDLAYEAGIPRHTTTGLREGKRGELVSTVGMHGKRVRRDVAKMDILVCALERGLSNRETAKVLGSLSKAFHKRARTEARDAIDRLRDRGGSLE